MSPRRSLVVGAAFVLPLIGGGGTVSAQAPQPPDDHKIITEHNLFSPSRSRPAPPPSVTTRSQSVATPAPPPLPPKFVLSGVVLEGDTALALLQEPLLTKDQVRVLPRGGGIGEYTVTAVFPDRVELEGPAGTISVPLRGPAKPAARGVASTPPAPPQPAAQPPPALRPIPPVPTAPPRVPPAGRSFTRETRPRPQRAPAPALAPPAPSESEQMSAAPPQQPAASIVEQDPASTNDFQTVIETLRQRFQTPSLPGSQ